MSVYEILAAVLSGSIATKVLERLFFPRRVKVSEDADVWKLYTDISQRYHDLNHKYDQALTDIRLLRDEITVLRAELRDKVKDEKWTEPYRYMHLRDTLQNQPKPDQDEE